MQTLNFQCGHCHGLMAVGADFLGQQVRCPHCQQVVVAPTAAAPDLAPPQPAPGPAVFQPERHDDIFTQPGAMSDSLFGEAAAPRIEIPREPAPAPWPATPPPEPAPASPAPEPAPTVHVPEPAAPLPPTVHTPLNGETAHWSPSTVAQQDHIAPTQSAAAPEAPAEQAPAMTIPRKAREAAGAGMFLPLVILPLFLWAVAATAFAVFLYLRLATVPPSLFDRFPDLDGDRPGVEKGKKLTMGFKKADALAPLPAHLHVKLKDTIRVGDVEVTPLGVEKRILRVIVAGSNPEPMQGPSLVLRLRIKNVAEDYSFAPMDNYFDRWWDGAGAVPLTILHAGKADFFGGPAKWYPRGSRDNREWVEGRQAFMPTLRPGEELDSFICTDGDNRKVMDGLAAHKGRLLWRVHLRRGLVEHKGRMVPAQCVIGVEFTPRDYGGA